MMSSDSTAPFAAANPTAAVVEEVLDVLEALGELAVGVVDLRRAVGVRLRRRYRNLGVGWSSGSDGRHGWCRQAGPLCRCIAETIALWQRAIGEVTVVQLAMLKVAIRPIAIRELAVRHLARARSRIAVGKIAWLQVARGHATRPVAARLRDARRDAPAGDLIELRAVGVEAWPAHAVV